MTFNLSHSLNLFVTPTHSDVTILLLKVNSSSSLDPIPIKLLHDIAPDKPHTQEAQTCPQHPQQLSTHIKFINILQNTRMHCRQATIKLPYDKQSITSISICLNS